AGRLQHFGQLGHAAPEPVIGVVAAKTLGEPLDDLPTMRVGKDVPGTTGTQDLEFMFLASDQDENPPDARTSREIDREPIRRLPFERVDGLDHDRRARLSCDAFQLALRRDDLVSAEETGAIAYVCDHTARRRAGLLCHRERAGSKV